MALLERVATLLRANVNDLLTKAEDPEKLARQLLLDMENQLLQVKTQVAIAMADGHRLAEKQTQALEEEALWRRKAELAVGKAQDDVARAALERALAHRRTATGLGEQHADALAEVRALRTAYTRLGTRLEETRALVERLSAERRRHRAAAKASAAQTAAQTSANGAGLSPLASSTAASRADAQLSRALLRLTEDDSLEQRLRSIETNDEVEALLLELKGAHPQLAR